MRRSSQAAYCLISASLVLAAGCLQRPSTAQRDHAALLTAVGRTIAAVVPPLDSSRSISTSCGQVLVERYGSATAPVDIRLIGFGNTATALAVTHGRSAAAFQESDGTIQTRTLGDPAGSGQCRVTSQQDTEAGPPSGVLLRALLPRGARRDRAHDLTVGRSLKLALAIGPDLHDKLGNSSCAAAITLAEAAAAVFERELTVYLDWLPPLLLPHAPEFADPEKAMPYVAKFFDQALGAEKYHIGHRVDLAISNGTGYGELNSACTEKKAFGYTTLVGGNPRLATELFMHEIAHHLGARHTNKEGDEVSQFSRFEPGKGTTIMGMGSRDPYFHFASIDHVTGWLGEQSQLDCGVHAPPPATLATLRMPLLERQVPQGTAFELGPETTGVNCVRVNEVDHTSGASPDLPLFRSFPECRAPQSFPSEAAAVGKKKAPDDALPTGQHAMRFVALGHTVEGRIVAVDTPVAIEMSDPFSISEVHCLADCKPGTEVTLTWNPANTFDPPFAIKRVEIAMRMENAKSWQALAEFDNRDETATVTIPATFKSSEPAYVRVKAVGGLFYAAAAFTVK